MSHDDALDAPSALPTHLATAQGTAPRALPAGLDASPCRLHDLVARSARRTPERIAVLGLGGAHDGIAWTFGELVTRARRLAHRLVALGAGPESIVGVFLSRSPDALVALLAVLEAGAAYLPLDPDYPRERLTTMLATSGATVVITDATSAATVDLALRCLPNAPRTVSVTQSRTIGSDPVPALGVAVDAENLAYMIYTSGSTGHPKGVQVPHRAIVNLLRSMARRPGLTADDVLLSITTFSFDIAALEVFLPLAVGGRVVLADRAIATDGLALREALDNPALGITAMQATPATWRMVIDAGWRGRSPIKVLSGGEALPVDLADQLVRRSADVWNVYGPTETTVWSTARRLRARDSSSRRYASTPVGSPIDATSCVVLDPQGARARPGVAGELLLGGRGLARGYRDHGGLTAERFVPDPFGDGERLYRTGDLVRIRLDEGGRSDIDFLGRIDHQVKVRGFRIELGEIEHVLRRHKAVGEAVVSARADAVGSTALIAYVVVDDGSPADDEALFDHLATFLPAHMVPAVIVRLDTLPLTPNGKVDRHALPTPVRPDRSSTHQPPEGSTEIGLAAIWSDVLGGEPIGRRDHFFHLGGHSLLASRVLSRVRERFAVEVPMRAVFEHPRLDDLATVIDSAERRCEEHALPPLTTDRTRGEPLPASFSQQRLWFLDRLTPDSAAYVLHRSLGLRGELDAEAMTAAVDALVQRHEALRTTFGEHDGRPYQGVRDADAGHLRIVDLVALADPRHGARQRIEAELRRPFALDTGPLFRAHLLRLGAEHHLLLLVVHHIVADGASLDRMIRDLAALYGHRIGQNAPPEALDVHFADYAIWERSWLTGDRLDRQLAFWRRHLDGAPPTLDLPTDRPRPPVVTFDGDRALLTPPPELAGDLGRACRHLEATPFIVILAAWALVLGRHADQQDVVLGTPVAHRPHPRLEPVVGFFANTLALRVRLDPATTFAELVEHVRHTVLDAFAHQDLPLEKLVAELAIERDLSIAPLFQVTLGVDADDRRVRHLGDLDVEPVEEVAPAAAFDLHLEVRTHALQEPEAALAASLIFNTALFDLATVERLGQRWLVALSAAIADPDRRLTAIDLEPPEERSKAASARTSSPFPRDLTARQLVEEAVDRHPEKTAVVFGDDRWSFTDLDRRANRLAHLLIEQGIGAEAIIGLRLARSAELVAWMVAVAKAGAAYVVLSPDDPKDRVEQIVEDTRMPVLVLSTAEDPLADIARRHGTTMLDLDGLAGQIAIRPSHRPPHRATAENTAYLIYTSGSTGRPKGSLVPSRALARLVRGTSWLELTATDVVAQTASPTFDAAAWEIWGALAAGATLVGLDHSELVDPPALERRLRTERVDVAFFTTALVHELARHRPSCFAGLRAVLFGGERCDPRWIRVARSAFDGRLLHLYGPSECTTYATWFEVERVAEKATSVPIGGPVSNTEILIVDSAGQPCPTGVPGELLIGGPGLTHGYLGRPRQTAERFVPHPTGDGLDGAGARLYRTGDRVRRLASGAIDFLGRLDRQVKLRGYRIEPGEIEAVLGEHPNLGGVLVRIVGDDEHRRLVAWAEAGLGTPPSPEALREYLAARLPSFMVPTAIGVVEAFAKTANGKIDPRALPMPTVDRTRETHPPTSPLERLIADLWRQTLKLSRVPDLDDHFFALGGHSLLATQCMSRLQAATGLQLSLRVLFDQPRLDAFASTVRAALERTVEGRETLDLLVEVEGLLAEDEPSPTASDDG